MLYLMPLKRLPEMLIGSYQISSNNRLLSKEEVATFMFIPI